MTTILQTELDSLIDKYKSCTLCKLGEQRENRAKEIVFGSGPVPTKGMIIGESPGPQEEREGIPFWHAAPAGELLTKLMQQAGLNRNEWFLTNAVLCAPLTDNGYVMGSEQKSKIFGSSITGTGAIAQCNSRLRKIVELVKPEIIVILGIPAYIACTNQNPPSISKVLGWTRAFGRTAYVSWHPAYYVRQKSILIDTPKDSSKYQESYDKVKAISDRLKSHWREIAEEYKKI